MLMIFISIEPFVMSLENGTRHSRGGWNGKVPAHGKEKE
jgi:hypothetical protein